MADANLQTDRILTVLIVDDEALARSRMVTLLGDLAAQCPTRVVGEAPEGFAGLELIEAVRPDVVLLDVQMPGMNGVEVARHAMRLSGPRPHIVFATAFDDFAIKAFEVQALDYLLKPVRSARLLDALNRARHRMQEDPTQAAQSAQTARVQSSEASGEAAEVVAEPGIAGSLARAAASSGLGRKHISVTERGRLILVLVEDVIYFKAELKYTTIRTAEREYIVEESLTALEIEFAERFIRIHRNALVARNAITGSERARSRPEADEGESGEPSWQILMRGIDESLPVSRRQWPAVRALIRQ
jgi:two-component system response regulator AlgR